jgi:uncharacterized membrane protein YraQ (UPF0718 family)
MTDFSFNLSDFVFVWWGLLFEALPFVVVGAILSGLLECCVSSATVARLFPKNRVLGIGLSACIGLLFPMCECGIVPIVRRLVLKGVPVSCAVTYLLASPIINPLVILSTWVAFRGKGALVVTGLRVGLAYLVAVVVGLAVWKLLGEKNVLLAGMTKNSHNRDHQDSRRSLPVNVLVHASQDFLIIGATLVVGAAAAALINSSISPATMQPYADNPFAAVAGMSVLAVVLNLCSEADAFVAASFFAFPLAAKLAFLVLGPMVDLKLIAMYTTVFRPKAIVVIMGFVVLLVFVLCVTGYVWMPATPAPGVL